MKTKEKPTENSAQIRITVDLSLFESSSSFKVVPETTPTRPGRTGKTHGESIETTPPKKAKNKPNGVASIVMANIELI